MAVKGKPKTLPGKKGRTPSKTKEDKQVDITTEEQETTLMPEIGHSITIEHKDPPSIKLKGKIRSIREGDNSLLISDDEWDTFYFEDPQDQEND